MCAARERSMGSRRRRSRTHNARASEAIAARSSAEDIVTGVGVVNRGRGRGRGGRNGRVGEDPGRESTGESRDPWNDRPLANTYNRAASVHRAMARPAERAGLSGISLPESKGAISVKREARLQAQVCARDLSRRVGGMGPDGTLEDPEEPRLRLPSPRRSAKGG